MDKNPENPKEKTGFVSSTTYTFLIVSSPFGIYFNVFFFRFPCLTINWSSDVMLHSFGEGYATRSDEEGFGGTYGGNQSFQKHNDEVHENHPGNLATLC